MNAANRKGKLTTYTVTIVRTIEYTAVVEVEARSAEEAVDVGIAAADAVKSNAWREGDIYDQQVKAKVKRG